MILIGVNQHRKNLIVQRLRNSYICANVKEGPGKWYILSTLSFLSMHCVVETHDDVSIKMLN